VAAQSAAAELGSAWRNGDGGGVSGLLRSIPYARRRREARRSWGLARRRPGRRGTARGGDGHGGQLGSLRACSGERGGELEREERRRIGFLGAAATFL
jgi:hypothetical protein